MLVVPVPPAPPEPPDPPATVVLALVLDAAPLPVVEVVEAGAEPPVWLNPPPAAQLATEATTGTKSSAAETRSRSR